MLEAVPRHLTLPMAVTALLPHRAPMLLVEQLLAFEPGRGTISAVMHPDNPFVDADGKLVAAALVELVAQGYAALKGYEDTLRQLPVKYGYLVGSRCFSIRRLPRVGDALTIEICTSAHLEGFSVIDGSVFHGHDCLATGSVKLWIP